MIGVNEELFLIMIPLAGIGIWALLGGLFHLIDWIHPNSVTRWARKHLVDASLESRWSKKDE